MRLRATLFVCCSFMSLCAFAFQAGGRTVEAYLSGGLLLPGSFDGSWYSDFPSDYTLSESTDPSWLLHTGLDCYIRPNLAVGLSLIFAPIIPMDDIDYLDGGVEHFIGKNDIYILDYCLGLTGRLPLGEIASLKAGLYAGGRSSFSSAPEGREFGVAIDGTLGVEIPLVGSSFAFAELGFLYQPYGGVIDVAFVRGGPIVYVALGLGF